MTPPDYLSILALAIPGAGIDAARWHVPTLTVVRQQLRLRLWHTPRGCWVRGYAQHQGMWEVEVDVLVGEEVVRVLQWPPSATPPTLTRVFDLLGERPPRALVPRRRRPRPRQLALFGGSPCTT